MQWFAPCRAHTQRLLLQTNSMCAACSSLLLIQPCICNVSGMLAVIWLGMHDVYAVQFP